MPTLSGFTRPTDPIDSVDIATQISTAIGKTVTCIITPTDIQVTGATITNGVDNTAIQIAVTAYVYSFFQYGAPLVDNPDMSSNRHNKGITEHAAYTADTAVLAAANTNSDTKTAVRFWEGGTFKNGAPNAGDIIIFTDSIATSGGSATFYPTSDHTSSGTALCSYLSADSFQPNYRDSSAVYAPGVVTVAGNLKSISIALTKLVFSGIVLLSTNILGSETQSAIPDSVVVKAGFWGISV